MPPAERTAAGDGTPSGESAAQSAESADGALTANPWGQLRRLTPARIALGRCGVSLPTAAQLEFQWAHARARDAVHRELALPALQAALTARGQQALLLHSAAGDRAIYLQRPDQGRRLNRESRRRLSEFTSGLTTETAGEGREPAWDLALVIADGLSALAIEQNLLPFLDAWLPLANDAGWRLAPLVLVEQGRVAIGDEIGQGLQVPLVAVLIGERPGLSSPDSMGIYLSYAPRVGLTDAERNCISNVRDAGLAPALAAQKLCLLISEARRRGLTGVLLKDDSPPRLTSGNCGNFLTDTL